MYDELDDELDDDAVHCKSEMQAEKAGTGIFEHGPDHGGFLNVGSYGSKNATQQHFSLANPA